MPYSYPESAFLLRGNRVDESGFHAPVTLQGATWVADADPFGGDALDTSTGTAAIAVNPRLALYNEDWTFEVWCKPTTTSANGNYIASIGVSTVPGYATVSTSLGAGGAVQFLASQNGGSWVNVSNYYGGLVPNGMWSFLEFTRRGPMLIAAANEVDIITYDISGGLSPISPGYVLIGGNPLSGYGDRLFQGLLGPMRFTQGTALRGAGGPLPVPAENFPVLPPAVSRGPSRVHISASAPVPLHSTPGAARLLIARDVEDGGRHRLYGTVELKGTPNLLLRRRVELWNQRDGRMVRQTWSDTTTGAWSFDYIRGGDGTRYSAVTYDHTGQKQAQIADNLEPEAMP